MKSICVYCGSNFGERGSYLEAAQSLGAEMAEHGITLVYGGGNVGLMGAVADSVLAAGGKVIGVIPQALVDKEVAHTGLSDLRVVSSMHERKSLMADLSDGFIALPGGLGTLEEFCEVATWTQLGFHKKACGLLNINNFYNSFLSFLDHATKEKFIRPEHRSIILAAENPVELIEKLSQFEVPTVHKWIDRNQQ
ncbi:MULTISPECIES: TIGR00730 family Rossman fold protein [Cyanophyceae]|uniref:LOG family protein n=1 Tax=Cyanophyceae TaxID=3028117 RepID=UPI0016879699|nr:MULTISPECIES: TIGR00730 family Rossman fold protein [Cyanophyceae]MBD1918295.1 TIGR00730 family Rossman fold protein [Phormidium sp. FACHB-77]MBD2028811.1 TIGR00730 family Rossman fold protein [Phormidium sp. FACHB-322]MBD2051232.1 TIGR00730 family Rossman fold protein [Leptolyngbya sp. FACHB-60]